MWFGSDGIEADDVVIDVHAGLALEPGLLPGLAAVLAPVEIGVDRPDRVGTVRIDEDLLVVRGAAAAIPVGGRAGWRAASPSGGGLFADARPRRTRIVRAVETGFVDGRRSRGRRIGRRRGSATPAAPAKSAAARRLGADQRVDPRRILRIDAERHAPHVVFRQPLRELGPLLSRVGRLPQTALRSAADHLADRAAGAGTRTRR